MIQRPRYSGFESFQFLAQQCFTARSADSSMCVDLRQYHFLATIQQAKLNSYIR